MKNYIKRLRALPLHIHKAISFLSMLGSSILGWICSQFSPDLNLGMMLCFLGLIGGIVWHIIFVRCPHCGHSFNPRASISNFCPYCGEKLN